MPKKKKTKKENELLDTKTHLKVTYEVWNLDGKLTYKIKEGLPDHSFTAPSRRAGTNQMKQYIKMMVEIENKNADVEKQMESDTDLENSDEFDDIFDFDIEEEKPVAVKIPLEEALKMESVKETPKETEGSKSEANAKLSSEQSTPPPQTGQKDGHEDETEDDVLEEDVEDSEEEIVEAPPVKKQKKVTYPKTPEIEWDLGFVVIEGTFYGKIGLDLYVTIKSNKFATISRNKFLEETRAKDLRVTKLKMRYVPVGTNRELLLRFVLFDVAYWIKRKQGHLYLEPINQSPVIPVFDHKLGITITDNRHMMLISGRGKKRTMEGTEKITETKYPSGTVLELNGRTFMRETYDNAVGLFEGRLHTKYINAGGHFVIEDAESGNCLMLANAEPVDIVQDGRPEEIEDSEEEE